MQSWQLLVPLLGSPWRLHWLLENDDRGSDLPQPPQSPCVSMSAPMGWDWVGKERPRGEGEGEGGD